MAFDLSKLLQSNPNPTYKQRINYVVSLSIPGFLAQISSILMEYIDASMVGHLGANQSASIGLVASSTWLLGSLYRALCIGFTIQVAHAVGSGDKTKAKSILHYSLKVTIVFALILGLMGFIISPLVPRWLGATEAIIKDATYYFAIFSLSSPIYIIVFLLSGMLQCSGNMKVPSILNTLMCFLDIFFNVFFIKYLDLGVKGAALGSSVAALITALLLVYFTLYKNDYLNLKAFRPKYYGKTILSKAIQLSFPIALEQGGFTGALVVVTRIISPLGEIALAANSFAVTAEALCYMPGYGIQSAATTLVGQATGAKRDDLVRSFAWISVILGSLIMLIAGILMYRICPFIFGLLTPVKEIQSLATQVLRIELFAEAFYGAAIVCNGALRGKGDTFIPSILNLISLWIVRISLSLLLVRNLGLVGIWISMALELTFRGIILLIRLAYITKSNTTLQKQPVQ